MKKRLMERIEDLVVGIPEERWRVVLPVLSIALNVLGVIVGTVVGTLAYRAFAG